MVVLSFRREFERQDGANSTLSRRGIVRNRLNAVLIRHSHVEVDARMDFCLRLSLDGHPPSWRQLELVVAVAPRAEA